MESRPPLSDCIYLATTISRWVPLVSYILSLDASPPQSWFNSQRNNEHTARGLSQAQIEEYVSHSILSSVAIGDTALVRAFLDAGLKHDTILEYRRDRVDCLLERAVQGNQPPMARYLLVHDADANNELL